MNLFWEMFKTATYGALNSASGGPAAETKFSAFSVRSWWRAANINMELTYDFQYGENHKCELLPVRDLEFAQDTPGLYAWYLRLHPDAASSDSLRAYARVFTSKTLDVTAQGIFNERYQGRLERISPELTIESMESMLCAATTMFSPPIYVGISKHIRTRLMQHFRCLENTLKSNANQAGPFSLDEKQLDSNEESESFGARLACLLRASEFTHVSGLFVKIIYNSAAGRAHLTSVESLLNRAFGPVCGRR